MVSLFKHKLCNGHNGRRLPPSLSQSPLYITTKKLRPLFHSLEFLKTFSISDMIKILLLIVFIDLGNVYYIHVDTEIMKIGQNSNEWWPCCFNVSRIHYLLSLWSKYWQFLYSSNLKTFTEIMFLCILDPEILKKQEKQKLEKQEWIMTAVILN